MQPLVELDRQLARLGVSVQRDGLADVVHHHPAGIAPGHVFLKLLADGRVYRAIHVLIEHHEQFFALHRRFLIGMEPPQWERLQRVPVREKTTLTHEHETGVQSGARDRRRRG